MTGNIALDVAIGLVFIYLLYSLLTTIICEIIASVFALRARNLQDAITKMLNDDTDKSGKFKSYILSIWHSIKKIFYNKQSGLAKVFYDQPSIKYLSKNNRLKKPSYIGPENFSQTLLNIMNEEGEGDTEIEKINSVLSKKIAGTKEEKFNAINQIISDQTDKKLESIQIKDLKKLIDVDSSNLSSMINEETRQHLTNLLRISNGDIVKFKAYLENWFDQTMERATGWYKRKNQLILFLVGLGIAISFNVNTFYLAKTLSKDEKARTQLVELANTYQQDHQNQTKNVNTTDSIGFEKINGLLAVKDSIEKDIQVANSIVGLGWERNEMIDEDYYESVFCNPCSGKAWANLAGWILTALALSMGATFWFDLLNKLVNLRTSLASSPKSKTVAEEQNNIKG